MKQEKSCGAIVYFLDSHEPQFLLIQHKKGQHWSFPKGHVENNETEEETARREIKEETGLVVSLNTHFRQIINFSPQAGVMKEVVYFLAEAPTKQVLCQDEEVIQYAWLSYESALQQVTYEDDYQLLQAAYSFMQTPPGESVS